MMATALPDGEYLHVFVSDKDREDALASEPDFLEDLHWGKRRVAGLRVLLVSAKPKMVNKLLTQAWASKAPKKLVASFGGTLSDPVD